MSLKTEIRHIYQVVRLSRRYRKLAILLVCLFALVIVKLLLSKKSHFKLLDENIIDVLKTLEIDYDTLNFRIKRYHNYRLTESHRTGPGEKGAGVSLSAKEKIDYDAMHKRETFNKYASDKISLERSLPDQRNSECKLLIYSEKLPSAGIVIIFCNEDLAPLLRTVHSVVNRSPPAFLKEVILLDDNSDKASLGKPLEEHIKKHWPDGIVRLIRSKERLGLVRARSDGARAVKADIVVFLDSHCEVAKGWLEPILSRIKENRTTVIIPTIDAISNQDISYPFYGDSHSVGTFWWSLFFTWTQVPEREKLKRKNSTDPIRTATMPGGLFAMDRKYFFELGGYDEGMGIWGGENLEISFRVWMCGGSLEILPCSHVGHMFRSAHTYTFPGKKDYNGINTKRLAEVWLDDYKRLFYMFRPDVVSLEVGDYSKRVQLRNQLKCKSFKWYLDNVAPEKYVMDENVIAYGMVSNPSTQLCIDYMSQNELDRNPVSAQAFPCQGGKSTQQIFSYSKKREIRREWACLTESYGMLSFKTCHSIDHQSQSWEFNKAIGIIQLKGRNQCVEASVTFPMKMKLMPCNNSSPHQHWQFEHYL